MQVSSFKTCCMLLAIGASAICHAERAPPAVSVALTGDDMLTQRLQQSLEREVSRSPDLRLVERDARFVIQTPSNVVPDKLGGRGVLVYRALLLDRGSVIVDSLGVCYKSDTAKCARDILRGFSRVITDHANRSP